MWDEPLGLGRQDLLFPEKVADGGALGKEPDPCLVPRPAGLAPGPRFLPPRWTEPSRPGPARPLSPLASGGCFPQKSPRLRIFLGGRRLFPGPGSQISLPLMSPSEARPGN